LPTNRIAMKLSPAAQRKIKGGHPWVFQDSISKQNKEGLAGDLGIVFHDKTNEFLGIGLYDPGSIIRLKMLHVGSPMKVDENFFKRRIQLSYDLRVSLLETETNAYRLFYGENDGMPGFIADVYDDHLVIKLYSAIWFPYLEMIEHLIREKLMIICSVLRLSRNLKVKNQDTGYCDGQLLFGTLKSEEIIFKEHGLKCYANLIKGHKTGYFLDHRANRLKIRSYAKDRKVLDIFSYAGGFSVNAIAGGATDVIAVDISEKALKVAQKNMRVNFPNAAFRTLTEDAFVALKNLKLNKEQFDLIILDPPSFAKKKEEIDGAKNSYKRLINSALPLLSKHGIILCASCSSRVSKEDFFDLVNAVFDKSKRKCKVLQTSTHDVDHPENIPELSYLKSTYIQLL